MGEQDKIILPEESRIKLDGIIAKMQANKESEESIQFVVNDFKQKYGQASTEPAPAAAPAATTEPVKTTATPPAPAQQEPAKIEGFQMTPEQEKFQKMGQGVIDTWEDTPQAKFKKIVGDDLNAKLKGQDVRDYVFQKNNQIYQAQGQHQKTVNQLTELAQYPRLQQYHDLKLQYNATTDYKEKEAIKKQMDELAAKPLKDENAFAGTQGLNGVSEARNKELDGIKTVGEAADFVSQKFNSANNIADNISKDSHDLDSVIHTARNLADWSGNADGVKEVGVLGSFLHGAASTIDASIDAAKLALSDDTQRKHLVEQDIAENMLFPHKPANRLAEFSEQVGGVAPFLLPHTALEELGAGAITKTVGGMLTDGLLMGSGAYSTSFKTAYQEALKTKEPDEAMKIASDIAGKSGAVGAMTGASFPLMGLAGAKVGLKALGEEGRANLMAGKPLTALEYVRMALPQNLIGGGLPMGIQTYATNKIMEAHDIHPAQAKSAGEEIAAGTMFGFMLNEVTGKGYLAPKVADVYKNTLAKFQFPEVVEAMNKGLDEGMVTPQLHQELLNDLAHRRKIFDAMPENQTPEQDAISFPYVDAIQKLDKQNQNPSLLSVHRENNKAEMDRLMADMQIKLGTPLSKKEQVVYDKLKEKEKGTEEAPGKLLPSEKADLFHFDERIKQAEINKKAEEKRVTDQQAQEAAKESPVISVGEMMDKPIMYKGQKATLIQDGNTVVAKTEGGREYELGPSEEVNTHPIKDYGIEQQHSVVSVNERGHITVRGDEYHNNYSDATRAINYDKDGNIVSVNLETPTGKKRTFRGDVAEDVAYQITLKELAKKNQISELENFINEDGDTKTILDAGLNASAESGTVEGVQQVPREKAERRDRAGKAVDLPGGERGAENGGLHQTDNAGGEPGVGAENVEGAGSGIPREGEVGRIQDAGGPEGGAKQGKALTVDDLWSISDAAGLVAKDLIATAKRVTGKDALADLSPEELENVGNVVIDEALAKQQKAVIDNKEVKEFNEFINEDEGIKNAIFAAEKDKKHEIAKPFEATSDQRISEEARNYGPNVIASRNRSANDRAASEAEAKRKVNTPAENSALQSAVQYSKENGLPVPKKHTTKKSDATQQAPIAAMYEKLQDVTKPGYKESKTEQDIFDQYKKKFPKIIKEFKIKDYKDLVEKAYAQLVHEVQLQFEKIPVRITFHDGTFEYKNSKELLDDVHNYNHLFVFRGGDDHVTLGSKTADAQGLTANDKFRAVHDYFGHATDGYEFGKHGEENAWLSHSKLFSPLAEWAMASETRGQNSWVNYSGKNEVALEKIKTGSAAMRKGEAEGDANLTKLGKDMLEEGRNEFRYADQKAIVLPPDMVDATKYTGMKKEDAVPEKLIPAAAETNIGSQAYKSATYPEGRTVTKTLPDKSKLTGTYKIVSADDVLASHNEETFSQTKGYPVNESGTTINDRDYSKDTNAQTEVTRIAKELDDRAISQTPVVTKDGIIVDGNNRTMSRKLAAKNGTDKEYLDALRESAEMYGLKPEDVDAVKNPMLVFEAKDKMPYDTKTLARFNKAEKKEKSPVERAVEVSKTISDRARKGLGDIYSEVERPSDVTSNPKYAKRVVELLQREGILQSNEIPRYFDVDAMVATKEGVAFMESLLMGGALNERAIRLLDNENMGNVRQKLIKAIVPLTKNAALGENALTKDIEGAIGLVNKAKQENSSVVDAVSQMEFFSAAKFSPEELALGIMLDGDGFAKFLTNYNDNVGKDVLFEGTLTKEKIIDNALRQKIENYDKVRHNLRSDASGVEGEVQAVDNEPKHEKPADGSGKAQGAEPAEKQVKKEPAAKSKLELAKEKRDAAIAKAKAIRDKQDKNLGVAKDPMKEAEERARVDREVFDTTVDLVREYIKDTADKALHTVEEFAKYIGEKVGDVKAAWDHVMEPKELTVESTDLRQATIEENRQKYGTGEVTEKKKTSRQQLENLADEKIKEGFDVKELISNILDKKHAITDIERTILGKYQAAKEGELDRLTNDIDAAIRGGEIPTAEALTDKRDKAIDELAEIHKAGEVSGSISGSALKSIQNQRLKDYSLANMFARKRKATGKKLTPEQIAEVQNQYKAIKEIKEKLEKKVAALEEKLKEKAAQNVVDQHAAEARKAKRAVTRAELKKERVDIIEDIKRKLQPKGVMALPVEVVPDIIKLAKNYAEDGFTRVQDVVDKIYTDLSGVVPGIEERDIRDAISGYGKQPERKTKTEIQKRIEDLKMQAKLISKLEDLEAKKDVPKSTKAKAEYSDEVKSLREKIDAFEQAERESEAAIKKAEKDAAKPTREETSLKSYKTRTNNRIAELREKIATGDYEKTVRPKLELDEDALKLKDEYRKARYDYELGLQRNELANRSRYEKIKSGIEEVLNVGRAVMTSFDFSAVLRQGLVATAAHPSVALKAAGEMFKQSLSQKRFERWFENLEESHEFTLMKDSGLYIADPHNISLTAKEEQFMTNLAAKVPVVGWLIKGSERAYVAYLNKMRADVFQNGVEAFESRGLNFNSNPEVFKAWAEFVNNSTGRGNLGALEGSAEVLNTAFFSPRLMAARMNLLNPVYYAKLPKEVRMKAIGDVVKTLGMGMVVMALSSLAGADVESDPRSTDFGKIKVGNTRWDVWGGFQGYVRLLAQLLTGQAKSANTGKISELDGKSFPFTTRVDKIGSFLRGKLAPIPALAYDLMEGENVVGEPVKIEPALLSRFAPMIYQDINKAAEEQGNKAIFTVGVPSLFGVSVNTFGDKKPKGGGNAEDVPVENVSTEDVKAEDAPVETVTP